MNVEVIFLKEKKKINTFVQNSDLVLLGPDETVGLTFFSKFVTFSPNFAGCIKISF